HTLAPHTLAPRRCALSPLQRQIFNHNLAHARTPNLWRQCSPLSAPDLRLKGDSPTPLLTDRRSIPKVHISTTANRVNHLQTVPKLPRSISSHRVHPRSSREPSHCSPHHSCNFQRFPKR